MNPKLYWIDTLFPGRLAISARPRGGDWLEEEIEGWRMAGVDAVVSLLTPQETEDLELQRESKLSAAHGIQFISLPIEDRGVPASWSEASSVVADVSSLLHRGRNVAIHCRQGIGRSGMIAAAVLEAHGAPADDALGRVSRTRGLDVPETPEQREWIRQFAKREAAANHAFLRAPLK